MSTPKVISIFFAVIVALAMSLPSAYADDNTQETQVNFDQPVEIPGQVLPAGSYWFVLADNDFDRNIVRIYSADRARVFATVQTEPTLRPASDSETSFNLVERRAGKPITLVNWFYSGESTGHEFVYSRSEERQLARDMRQGVSPAQSPGYLGGD
jgi:hypothetical protein